MQEIRFTVLGLAQPAGSKRAFAIRNGRGEIVTRENGAPVIAVTDDNPKGKQWKSRVADAARAAYSGPLLDGPLKVEMRFIVPRPKGHYGSGRNASFLRESAPEFPTVKPDVLKLARATEDALTGVIWRDDAQTVILGLTKEYGEPARCEVLIRPLANVVQPDKEVALFETRAEVF